MRQSRSTLLAQMELQLQRCRSTSQFKDFYVSIAFCFSRFIGSFGFCFIDECAGKN